jgi:hypothetical protein
LIRKSPRLRVVDEPREGGFVPRRRSARAAAVAGGVAVAELTLDVGRLEADGGTLILSSIFGALAQVAREIGYPLGGSEQHLELLGEGGFAGSSSEASSSSMAPPGSAARS